MNRIIKISLISSILLSTSVLSASTSIIRGKKDKNKFLNKEFYLLNELKTQKINSQKLQITDYLNGEVILDNFNGFMNGFKIKAGFNSILKFSGPTLPSYLDKNIETKQDEVQGYGSIQFNLLDSRIAGVAGIFKLHTPLLNNRVSYSIFDTYYGGAYLYSKYSIDNYDLEVYGGYVSHENREMTKIQKLDNAISSIGLNIADEYGNKFFSQVALQDKTYELFIESQNAIRQDLKVNSSLIYVDNSDSNLEKNYLVGLEGAYLIDGHNYITCGYTYKNKTNNSVDFLDTLVNSYTNGLFFNPLENKVSQAIKFKYVNRYNDNIKNSFYLLKYFTNFNDKIFDDNDYEIGFENQSSLEKYMKNTSLKIQAGYIGKYDYTTQQTTNDKLFRVDFVYKY